MKRPDELFARDYVNYNAPPGQAPGLEGVKRQFALYKRKTGLDSHLPFLRERWKAGCHNIAQLYRELVARGYTRSYASVYEQLVRLRAMREEGREPRMHPLSSSPVLSAGDFPLPPSV